MTPLPPRTRPHRDDPHDVTFFHRHSDDDPTGAIPARQFLAACPTGVRAKSTAVLVAVATAPPSRFSGGGYWEAMHGDVSGYFEVRLDGPKPAGGKGRHHYRLYCLLDYEAKETDRPLLVVITGLDKPYRTALSPADYAAVRRLGEEYLSRNPRSIA
ncbi:hypothetical protein [Planomonospora venezuelensis]|uniref:Uncharacterized protein n=1 Tax=Planomonospora venezuelensis TaxID=1999 RepID=A0A841D3G4_PLAVE|nr:hypothetical protein [Planomonospora venezuelensis]MBB5962036.1 hypothetical protein [Planomonospora venezuelensis]GIN00136.1 hypothetical protein Pve01_17940 [Planomonospora venezuelensis]